jgi:hypothetical protein
MAAINLSMAVEIDTTQLDDLNKKLEESNKRFLEKIEKATTILPKGAEKVDHAWLKMMSNEGVYVDRLMELIKRGFDQICYKNCNPKGNSRYYESKLIRAIIAAVKKHKLAIKKRIAAMFLIRLSSFGPSSRSLPQYRQTKASSLISSAQYGHFFIAKLRLEGSLHA